MNKLLLSICTVLVLALIVVPQSRAQDQKLFNVALTDLGANASGSGVPFNKDWPAINAIQPIKSNARGTLFGHPLIGARIEIKLVKPVKIAAIETTGLDYNGTQQPKAIEIHVDGKLIKKAELADTPGKPVRTDIDATGRTVVILVTDEYPRRTLKDGKTGPNYGGWKRLAVLSPEDLSVLMTTPAGWSVKRDDNAIAPTQGAVAEKELKVIGEPRQADGWPRTLWDKQDIAHYKKMLETSKELQKQYADLKKAMDERLTRPVGVPEPRKDAEGNWMHLPEKEVNKVHNALGLDIANMGTMYVLSGDAKYGEFAKKILLDYAAAFPNYGVGSRPGFNHDPSKVFDQRLSDATWLIQVARGYDLIHELPSISSEEREKIEKDLLRASAEFIAGNRHMLGGATNWSAIATTSILTVGVAIDAKDLIDMAMYGKGGTKEKPTGGIMLHFGPKSIGADGLWSEGSTGYQMMAMEALVNNAEILWRNGVDMYRHRDGALKQLFDSPIRYAYPDFKTPAIHDGGGGSIIGYEANLWEYGYLRYGDPQYLSIIQKATKNLNAQFQKFPVSVLYDLDPTKPAPPIEYKSFNFFDIGFGINRITTPNGVISMLLDYGPNRSHGHPDKLSVDLYAFNQRLIPDPGSIWYEQPLYKNWYATTVSHNTLVVNGNSQRPADATQLVYGFADTMSLQRGWTDQAYSGVTMDRSLFLTPEYMADIFGAFSQMPHQMDLAWHFVGDLKPSIELTDYAFPTPVQPGYSALTEVKRGQTDQAWNATIQAKNGVARFVAAGGSPTEIIVGNGFMGNERPPTVLQRRAETNQTIYGNVVDISGNAEPYVKSVTTEGSLDAGYSALKVETVRGTDVCFTAFKPGTYESAGIKTDAQQALVVMDADNVRGMFIGGGTTLSRGAVSIARSSPGLAYIEKTDLGAYVVGNPSGTEADLTLNFAVLSNMEAFALDLDGRRTGPAKPERANTQLTIKVPAGGRVEFAAAGVPSAYDHKQEVLKRLAAEKAAAEAALREASIARNRTRVQEAQAKPAPAGTTIVAQAETFAAQGEGTAAIAENKTAAVGTSLSQWNNLGHWLEWKITVPAEGYYNLSAVYCTQNDAERDIIVNGEVQEPAAPLSAPSTGGFSNGTDDWSLATAIDPINEAPLLIKLKAGENVVRLKNSNGRPMNLDYLLITSPDAKPARIKAGDK